MSSVQKISLAEILELAGDIPAEGILKVIGRVAHKVRHEYMVLEHSPEEVCSLYQRFQSNEEVERTFSYLFAKFGEIERARESYKRHIHLLEKRTAYGMAGDVATEADKILGGDLVFKVRAEESYIQQITEMDKERSRDGKTNETYYDEMLFKAGQREGFRQSVEPKLKYWLGRGEFGLAAGICDKLERYEEAEKYRKLDQILKLD